MDPLRTVFGNRILSQFALIQWPPRSPDLSAPDFFLWGHLKARVYRTKPRIIEELVTGEVRAIDEETSCDRKPSEETSGVH
jgi:hypothetical protein